MKRLAGGLLALALPAAPLAAEAQTAGKVARIGWLSPGPPTAAAAQQPPTVEGFRRGLQDRGYLEGENIIIERRYAEWRLDRLPTLAGELVAMNVEAIVVVGPAGIRAAQQATRSIPIVMMASSTDPVADGLVASLNRPGGNITGVTAAVSPEIAGKQLELLTEALGSAARVALWDVRGGTLQRDWDRSLQEAARRLGVKVDGVEALAPADFERAVRSVVGLKADALYVATGGATYVHRIRVAELALRHRLPTIAYFRELPESGGLMSYGPNVFEIYRRAAWYVDRILKGAKPADLPVEQPTKFELVINLRTRQEISARIHRRRRVGLSV